MSQCPLCYSPGGQIIFENSFVRAVNPGETAYPNFTRIILREHHKEMTDLSTQERALLMEYVYATEQVQRQVLNPDKINLAQFGTMTPHIHWHIIPRYQWDLHYPNSFWSQASHDGQASEYLQTLQKQRDLLYSYQQELARVLAQV